MTEIEIMPPEMPGKVNLPTKLRRYALLVRLDRPIGILLLLWPTLCALWIAGAGQPPWQTVVVFMLGVVLMRSAGCAINDYADREIDGHVARTCKRPLAMGLVSPREALAVFVVLCLIAFGLAQLLNRETIQLAVVAVVLAGTYPFSKRYTHFPQVILGAAFGWAVPMSFMAITGTVPVAAWVLFAATLLWALVYDTEYAMVDREDDLKVGVKSTAILFGRHDITIIAVLQLVVLALLVWVGYLFDMGLIYYLGLAISSVFFIYQLGLLKTREPKACFDAFLNNNLFGMTVFVAVVLDYALSF